MLVGAGKGREAPEGKEPGPKGEALSNCCLRLVEKEGKPGYELCWKAENVTASYATPLAHRDHAYFVNEAGVVFCLDLKTGKQCYAERLGGPCWASPVGAGDRVYFFGKDGVTSVLEAGPKFEVLAANRLWIKDAASPGKSAEPKDEGKKSEAKGPSAEYLDPIVYGVAVVDGAFFVRTGTALYRIGKP